VRFDIRRVKRSEAEGLVGLDIEFGLNGFARGNLSGYGNGGRAKLDFEVVYWLVSGASIGHRFARAAERIDPA
jgi:hypothetical protein